MYFQPDVLESERRNSVEKTLTVRGKPRYLVQLYSAIESIRLAEEAGLSDDMEQVGR
jgi:hypothetical protein